MTGPRTPRTFHGQVKIRTQSFHVIAQQSNHYTTQTLFEHFSMLSIFPSDKWGAILKLYHFLECWDKRSGRSSFASFALWDLFVFQNGGVLFSLTLHRLYFLPARKERKKYYPKGGVDVLTIKRKGTGLKTTKMTPCLNSSIQLRLKFTPTQISLWSRERKAP